MKEQDNAWSKEIQGTFGRIG